MNFHPGVLHWHYKGGGYRPLLLARNSEAREEKRVIYVSLSNGEIWDRPLKSPGQDSWLDMVLWPDGKLRHRFDPDYALSSAELFQLKELWQKARG